MDKKKIETYCPNSSADWRRWLEKNHQLKQSIWLIYFKSSTKIPSLSWSEAVDEALCFGWIDSTKKTIDDERYMQYFSRRKPKSTWSKINKDKVTDLIERGVMMKEGLKSIEIAKENGAWVLLDDVENLIIPEDLKVALSKNGDALDFFERQSKSIKKGLLYWVISAKRIETRSKRIAEVTAAASKETLPNQFR